MSAARFLAFSVIFAVLLACGEVGDGPEYRPSSSSSQDCKNCLSSSNNANSSSSSSDFDIGIIWEPAPEKSYVHGTTQIRLDFYSISKGLITQAQYKAVMGTNPSKGVINDTLPVEGVTWFKAMEFCGKLSALMDLEPGVVVKLPTEAEWEYVAIPGIIQRNPNYWEWTNDCWDELFPYEEDNPSGPHNCLSGEYKVRKGFEIANRIEDRYPTDPYSDNIGSGYISFRVVLK
jgi:hypothetical protein